MDQATHGLSRRQWLSEPPGRFSARRDDHAGGNSVFFPTLAGREVRTRLLAGSTSTRGIGRPLWLPSCPYCRALLPPYGGYSPNPVVFLAAAAQVTRHARLVTGAVLPAFNNPLKVAGELAMLDALCDGRLDCGFARAFLPHEFAHFGGQTGREPGAVRRGRGAGPIVAEQENVTSEGRFYSFHNITSLPRPTQTPRPPFYVAALGTRESFERAGANGYGIMAIPMAGAR